MTDESDSQPFEGIALGVFAPTLIEQFASMLPSEAHDDLHHYELDNVALSRVRVRALIAPGAVDKAREKLCRRVTDLLLKHGAVVKKGGKVR